MIPLTDKENKSYKPKFIDSFRCISTLLSSLVDNFQMDFIVINA